MDKRLGQKVGKVFLFGILGLFLMINFVSAFDWSNTNLAFNCSSSIDAVNGVISLEDYQGSIVYNSTNALIGDACQVWDNNNFRLYSPLTNLNEGGTRSMNLWFRMEDTTTYDMLYSNNASDYPQSYVSSGTYTFSNFGSVSPITGSASDTNYHMLTMVNNGTGLLIYMDNVLSNYSSFSGYWGNITWNFGVNRLGTQDMIGQFDEIVYFDYALDNSNINELWNGGIGIPFIKPTTTANLTNSIYFPENNSILLTEKFTVIENVSSNINVTIFNSTLKVYNSGGSITNTETKNYNLNLSNFTETFETNITGSGRFSFDIEIFYNDTDGIVRSKKTDKEYFTNGAEFRIVDENNLIVSDGQAYLNSVLKNSNPFYLNAVDMSNPNNETVTINASSIGGYYIDNNTFLNINLSEDYQYNITLNSYKTHLFFEQGGSAYNTSGYITDYNYSYTFYNASYLIPQVNLSSGIIYVRFIDGKYNQSVGLTWENKSQFYEYDNSVPYLINEMIEIFDNIDTSSYFQTQDNSGNTIKGATLRLYATIPTNVSDANTSYAFYGQRITDNNGRTVFAMDSEAELYLTASATGYQTKTIRLTASEITTFTSDDPFVIRLERSAYTTKDNVFISDLWKINGTKVYPSYFDDLSVDYFMFIYDYYERDLVYSTSYEGINRTISLDSVTKSGIISLASGEQFSSTDNSTWYLYIWADDSLIYTISVSFNQEAQEVILDVVGEGLDSNDAWKVVVFFGLILSSILMGLLFRTPDGEAGVHTFFVGGFISSLAVAGFGWLTIMGVFHYLGKLVKKWVSE